MATNMNVSLAYGTHLPCLIKALSKTTGDILELGTGIFSTPYLRYQCMLSNRLLVSYENYKNWYDFLLKYYTPNENHQINFIEKYADAPIDRKWDVVLIDQTPDSSRTEEIRRLANFAKYIVVHDTNKDQDKIYHFSEVYPLFKYKTIWDKDGREATVLSNFVDLEDFWK